LGYFCILRGKNHWLFFVLFTGIFVFFREKKVGGILFFYGDFCLYLGGFVFFMGDFNTVLCPFLTRDHAL
jgi:hypothetical protein